MCEAGGQKFQNAPAEGPCLFCFEVAFIGDVALCPENAFAKALVVMEEIEKGRGVVVLLVGGF